MAFGILIFRSIFPTLPFVSPDPNEGRGLFPLDRPESVLPLGGKMVFLLLLGVLSVSVLF
jgi:hypothetical protein